MVNLRPLSPYIVTLYPQNGDCIVTIDSVTLFHPVYSAGTSYEPVCLCRSVCVSPSQCYKEIQVGPMYKNEVHTPSETFSLTQK